ncbi:MAG: universal stress protein [Candidatus Dadabacteria bacterium]|nr:MAG: universal stress protein [Candidatus Dadabacteria bacterium]
MLPEIRTILFASDLSPRAPDAFRWAMSLAQRYDAKIIIVHALEPLTPMTKSMVDVYLPKEVREKLDAEGRQRIMDRVRERLELFCQEETCTDPQGRDRVKEIRIVEGRPSQAILDEAERCQADVIVMGSHGHSAVGEVLLGSVAHRVTQRAKVPVLVVRHTG